MDISAHPRLDPKLKETYDRIMGTSVGVKTPLPQPEKPTKVATPSTHHAEVKTPQQRGHLSHLAYSASNPKKETAPQSHEGKKTSDDSLLFTIIMGAGGVLFFVFYTIFWMSFLGF